MMKKHVFLRTLPLIAVLFLGACQKPTMYEWGSYDATLLDYYKDVSQLDAFEAELFALIEQGGYSDKPMAPGIYAEYGFLQMQKGENQTAVKFFKMEKKTWPESKLLMDTMIRAAGGDENEEEKKASVLNETKEG